MPTFCIVIERTETFRGDIEADTFDQAQDRAIADLAEHNGDPTGLMRFVACTEIDAYNAA